MRPVHRSVAATLLVVAAACRAPAPEATMDTRTPLALPTRAADAVRSEMRAMLGSIQELLAALPPRDTAAMRRAAVASGMAAAADTALEHLLPEAFLTLGTDTHQRFDSLGTAIAGGLAPDSVVARLAGITSNCVSCHKLYRLTAARVP